MPLVRGTSLVHFRSYVREHFGAPALDRTLRALAPPHAALVAHALPDEWYPVAAQHAALLAFDRAVGRGDLATLAPLGAYTCTRDLSGSLGWVFRLCSPARIVGHTDVLWRRFHSTGTWTTRILPHSIELRLDQWNGGSRPACLLLQGYLGALLEQLSDGRGALRHPHCAFRGARACEFVVDVGVAGLAPLDVDVMPGDSVSIGRELGQLTSYDAVREAVIALFRAQTQGCDARFSLADPEGLLVACASSGQGAREDARQWLLEARGRVVGQLDAHFARNDPRAHTVGELVPWMALALANVEPAVTDPHAAMRERIRSAVERWGLTPRQQEILAMVVDGRSNRQIAIALERAEGTIEIHVKALLKKASVSGRTELTARVATMPTRK
jgi:DNA-binding CsgD family transcriptional regulator